MQKMAIFQRFSRTFRECSALAKSANAFTIGGGELLAYPQAKSDNAMNMFNIIRNVPTKQGSYFSNCKKNPQDPLCFRGEGHHLFNTSRYNHSGPFTPLRANLVAVELPVNARRFYRPREKQPSTMPERNRNIRDHKRRLLAAKYEVRRKLYKALCRDPDLPTAVRMKHRAKLSKLPRNSAFVRVTNRCIISGRSRAVYKKFRLSRIVFRNLANQGQLMGIKKASW